MKIREQSFFFINLVTRVFTVFVVFQVLASGLHGAVFDLPKLLRILAMASAIGLLTMLRINLESRKWMLKRSFLMKRWIFMPGYLLILLLFLSGYGFPGMNGELLLFGVMVFLCVYSIVSVIVWLRYRMQKREYSVLLEMYKSKLEQGTK